MQMRENSRPPRATAHVGPAVGQASAFRWGLASLGVLATFLAAVGVVVPGMPTTIFVILASYAFTRSCPWLERRLLRNRLFARSMRYVDGTAELTRALRLRIAGCIVGMLGLSALVLGLAGRLTALWAVIALPLGAAGVLFVWRWRRTEDSVVVAAAVERCPVSHHGHDATADTLDAERAAPLSRACTRRPSVETDD